MKPFFTHFSPGPAKARPSATASCRRRNTGRASFTVTGDPDRVTCESCKKTRQFKESLAALIKEAAAPLSPHDHIFEQGWNSLLRYVDGETLRAGLSKRSTATLYRELANQCRERAGQLDEEAHRDDEEAAEEAEF